MAIATSTDVERRHHPGSAPHPGRGIECVCFAERVAEALRRTGYSALTRIDVSVRTGAVLLEGRVTSYHLKQLAQETVRQVFGEAAIRNELEVTSW
jgi:hypothetical protein